MPLAPRNREAYNAIENALRILPLIENLEPAEGVLIEQAIESLSTARQIIAKRLEDTENMFRHNRPRTRRIVQRHASTIDERA